MKLKVLCMLMFGCMATCAFAYDDDRYQNNPYFATDSRYDYLYANPPRQSFDVRGRYIISSSKVRYVHSPSRLKGAKHAARINANNMMYAYGY